ncbi:MAG TPA: hypothetical protein VFQ42_22535 [Mycobacterium sp.]|nr:hypothetical protein [Mycobacterium sp.]
MPRPARRPDAVGFLIKLTAAELEQLDADLRQLQSDLEIAEAAGAERTAVRLRQRIAAGRSGLLRDAYFGRRR